MCLSPARFRERRGEYVNPSRRRSRRGRRRNIYDRRRTTSYSARSGIRGPKRNRYAHIVFTVLVVAVIVFVFTRDESDPEQASTSTVGPAVEATTVTAEDPPDSTLPTTAIAGTEETAATTAPTTTTQGRESPVLTESATGFVNDLAELNAILAQLVSEISAANVAWDNRDETGARFEDTEAAISDVVERTRALAETTGSLPVPSILADRHGGSGGPVERAAGLVPLAEAVLEGLRLPSPDDGSTRRDALADFVSAADAFAGSVDELIGHVEENAENLGLALAASATTVATTTASAPTTTTQPSRELSEEALSYTDGLQGFSEVLVDLVAHADGANRAWDNSGETGATYRETADALNETIDRARSFSEQVRSLRVPDAVGTLGDGPIQHAARLPALADGMLEGLRIPAPDDGSTRRDALAGFKEAAEDFADSVDNLLTYIEENAASLGLIVSG